MSAVTGTSYLVVAYRWGNLNLGHHFVYLGTDEAQAIARARAENENRGGNYGCVVYEFRDGHEQRVVAYFPSSWGEKHPLHNTRIDMLISLGLKFEDFAKGTVWLPSGDPDLPGLLEATTVEPPEWVKKEYGRVKDFYDFVADLMACSVPVPGTPAP